MSGTCLGGMPLPSVVGNVNINSNTGTVNFGDTLVISPDNIAKTVSGQGGGNIGNVVNTVNGTNLNNTADPDAVDASGTGAL